MKKLITLALALIMTFSLMTPAMAAPAPKYTEEAQTLYELGLFRGTGTNPDGTPIFALGNTATRMQALIMLIRLLGLEDEALSTTTVNPFSDVDNAGVGAKYAAYAYEVGLTKGIGNGKFGTSAATPAQYLTFVLRALGYDDGAGDFTVATAAQKAVEIGLLTADLVPTGATLLRDDCAKISHEALKVPMKGSDKLLAEKLIEDGTLTEKAVGNSGILNRVVYLPFDANYQVKCTDIAALFDEINGMAFCSRNTNDAYYKFQQMNFTPEQLMLSMATRYCAGVEKTQKKNYVWKPRSNETWQVHASPDHYDWILMYDRDAHLIGYSIVPPLGYKKEGTVPVVLCHIDLEEEIEQQKKATEDAIAGAVEFSSSALSTTSVSRRYRTERGNEYDLTRWTLLVDREKLPEEVKDFQYFAFYAQFSGTKEQMAKEAWCAVDTDPLRDSKDYSPIQPIGAEVRQGHLEGGHPKQVVLLYDANKTLVGYSFVNGKLPDTNTVIHMSDAQ